MKIAMDEIFYMNEFDKFSGVNARDCIIQRNTIIFVVDSDKIGKAIGKKGTIVRGFGTKINKRVVLLPYYDSIKRFLEESLNIELNEVDITDGFALLKVDSITKRKLVNNIAKFKLIKQVALRNYGVKGIKVK